MSHTLLQQRINELVDKHGSIRNAAAAVEVDHVYLFRLSTGERTEPSDDVLRKLKLRRVVTYIDTTKTRRKNAKA